jgi:hypothetical protein
MSQTIPIDITNMPELVRIAEEVEATKTPRELKRENKTVAVIMPARSATAKKKRIKTKADYEAFRSAAGSWKGLIEAEQFKKDMYASRKLSTRPSVKL